MIRAMRHRLAIALLALGLASAGCGGDGKRAATATPKPSPVPTKTPDDKPFKSLVKINEVGHTEVDGGIRFRVTSLGEVRRIPMVAGSLTYQYGFRLVRARVSYTNRTKLPVDLLCHGKGFELLDNEQHHHQPVKDIREIVGNEEVCKQPVLPGGTSKLVLAYRFSSVYKVQALEVFNSAEKRDPDGEHSRLRFVNPKR
jgi:hypothetical protein